MKALLDFLHAHGPTILAWITGSLIPSVLVGLTKAPAGKSKVADICKAVLQILAITSHKDQEGTFKAPFTRSLPPVGAVPTKTIGKKGAATILILWLSASTSCAWIHQHPAIEKVGHDAYDCTVEAIKSRLPHLVPALVAILMGGKPDMEAQIDAFKADGEDALACAMQQAATDLENASTAVLTPQAGREELQKRADSAAGDAKAKAYITKHGWAFKTVATPR